MHVHVGCSIVYACPQPTPMLFVLRPSLNTNHYLIEERRITNPVVPINQYMDSYGNEIWRLVAPVDRLQIEYDALIAVPSTPDLILPDLPKTAIENLPYDVDYIHIAQSPVSVRPVRERCLAVIRPGSEQTMNKLNDSNCAL